MLTPKDGLGTGIGAIPAGSEVVIDDVLPPFSPGVAQADENTILAVLTFTEYVTGPDGAPAEAPNTRRLAFGEADFRSLFTLSGGGA